ncbi:MAG: Holliday junction resolvase RuvX [Pseudomonadales bacterium]|nr:Holliday junction resolvase RuvX [Pseudomonadales bacterium]
MAFDFGLKHIGVAVGQTQTFSASPLTTINATFGKPDWRQMDTLINEWNPDLLLIGLPINMDGTNSEMSDRAKKFANRLNARFQCPVELVDERLSSFEVSKVKARPEKKHALAAQVIAETWLNDKKASPE